MTRSRRNSIRRILMLAFAALPCLSPASAQPAGSAFEKADCPALGFAPDELGAGVECGWLNVPESRARPGRALRLAVVVARATESSPAREPMLYLHGGPGIATLDVIPRALKGKSWPLLRRRHDLVFFDMRGTGRSTPAICPEFNRALEALNAQGASGRAAGATRLAAARACRKELRSLNVDPASYSSTAIAEDVETLRTALGVDRWNVFATSFGSLPAGEIVRRRPATVRALILDSAFPPNSTNRAEQIGATASSFREFQRRCDAIPACRNQFPSLRHSTARIARRLDRAPIVTTKGRVTGESFRGALWTLMVSGSTARYLPELLRRAGEGDDELIRRFVAVFGDTGFFGGYAHAQAWLVNCHDIFPRPSRALQSRAVAANPDLGGDMVAGHQDAVCDTLQPSHAPRAFYGPLGVKVPTLILFGEFDPATPRSDAVTARHFFKGATLVEIAGASHAPFYTDDCTKGIALAFVAAPDAEVDRSCLAGRAPFAFADGKEFDEFVAGLDE